MIPEVDVDEEGYELSEVVLEGASRRVSKVGNDSVLRSAFGK